MGDTVKWREGTLAILFLLRHSNKTVFRHYFKTFAWEEHHFKLDRNLQNLMQNNLSGR